MAKEEEEKYEKYVFGPAFAELRQPRDVCLWIKFSSGNLACHATSKPNSEFRFEK
jgi:hypothetical protein